MLKVLLLVLVLFGIATMVGSNFELLTYSAVQPARKTTEDSTQAFAALRNATIPLTAILLAVFYQMSGPQTIKVPVGLGILFVVSLLLVVWMSLGNTQAAFDLFFILAANVFLAYLVIYQLKRNPLALDRAKSIVATNLFLVVLAAVAVTAVYLFNAVPIWLERLAKSFSVAAVAVFAMIFFNNPQGTDAFALATFFLVVFPSLVVIGGN